jgi:hypothetical protein
MQPPERNTREIRRQFGVGMRRCVARGIWEQIALWYPGLNQLDLALRVGFESQSSVSDGLNWGELSLESLVVILTRTEKSWQDLPPLPSEHERILAGYCQALAYQVRGRNNLPPPPNEAEVLCLAYLHAHPDRRRYFELRPSNKGEDLRARTAIAEDVLRRAEDVLRRVAQNTAVHLPLGDQTPVAFLDELNQTWAQAYDQTRKAVYLEVP